ncbi:hypothetical protein [Bacillus mycoides]|uniref:hypothetical protein n=1 Tax=Bacillus mycoides TaxID=1405 RepID=UPI002E1D48B0|nr:hypothetical protein [Bacillus mycoides]
MKKMIKTLFAGGTLGTEDMKSDQKVEKSQYSETIKRPEGTGSQPEFEIGDPEKLEYTKTVERPEGTDSKPTIELDKPDDSEYAKAIEMPEDTESKPVHDSSK